MPRGGKRQGAGRPVGTGKFKEKTKPIRVPESMVEQIMDYANNGGYKLPLYGSKVAAGFPSPADDYMEERLDLNEYLVQHPSATFFVRVSGTSMVNAGIQEGDILVVDRSLEHGHGKIVIAAVDGELTVKRLHQQGEVIKLMPENPAFEPIDISQNDNVHIWGVVTNVVHKL